jgi:hypothetical protein
VGECQQDIAGSGKGKDNKDEGEEDSQGKARNNSRDNDKDNAATRRRQWRKGNSQGDKGDGNKAARGWGNGAAVIILGREETVLRVGEGDRREREHSMSTPGGPNGPGGGIRG